MQKDFMDSIKARLYDFKYTPFLSSYIFSWLYINSKLLLIFFSINLKVEEKIEMLAWSDVSYITPLLIALIYVAVFPAFTLGFYWITLKYKKWMSEIQVNIENETPLDQDKVNKLRNKYRDIEVELNETFSELETAKARYKDKFNKLAQNYIEKENTIEQIKKDAIDKAVEPIQKKLDKVTLDLENTIDAKVLIEKEKAEEIEKLKAELEIAIAENEKYVSSISDVDIVEGNLINDKSEKIKKLIEKLSNDQKNILKIFNDNDSSIQVDTIKRIAFDTYKINKPMVDLRLKELVDQKILKKNSLWYSLEDNGLKIIELIFN